jgi:hypothetical protein
MAMKSNRDMAMIPCEKTQLLGDGHDNVRIETEIPKTGQTNQACQALKNRIRYLEIFC